jgi:hypothetical protein
MFDFGICFDQFGSCTQIVSMFSRLSRHKILLPSIHLWPQFCGHQTCLADNRKARGSGLGQDITTFTEVLIGFRR